METVKYMLWRKLILFLTFYVSLVCRSFDLRYLKSISLIRYSYEKLFEIHIKIWIDTNVEY